MKEERGITSIDIFISFLISFVKIYCGTIFCSYTLITSGYYTLCNLSSDIISFNASLVRGRRGSKKEPFGYGTIPMVLMIFFGLVLCFLGLFIIGKSFFVNYELVNLKIVLPIIIIIVSLIIWSNKLFEGAKRIQSELLMEIAHENYYDFLLVFILIFFVILGAFIPVFDLLGTIFMAIMIFIKGLKILIDNVILLKGQNDQSKMIIKNIENNLKEGDGIYYSNCSLINVSNFYKVIIEILVDENVSIGDLIFFEEYSKGKIKSKVSKIKMIDFLIYRR